MLESLPEGFEGDWDVGFFSDMRVESLMVCVLRRGALVDEYGLFLMLMICFCCFCVDDG